jgi:hypothetical protein
MVRFADRPMAAWLLGAVAFAFAATGAKPFAGGWNDASRLATVESLLDRGTLAIDDSIFVRVPASGIKPYSPDRADLLLIGTYDKLFVNGRYYSDKPLFAGVMMAALYRPLEWLGAPAPAERPDVFIRLMTIFTCGLGYAVATGCLWMIGRRVGLAPARRLGWLAAFALCTYAPTYTQHVNSGAMQLGLLAVMALLLTRDHRWGTWNLVALGTLAGIAFNLDFGSGPPLVGCTFALVWWQTRRLKPVATFSLGVLPWVAAGIGINDFVGGVWKPLNMYPEHFLYPGSPFTQENLTGDLHHEPLNLFLYAGGMLFGKHGFFNHNLPMLLILAAGLPVLRRAPAELKWLAAWCALTWLMYAVLSNNMGGGCCSVRWFVPFLVPGFWLLARLLHEKPQLGPQFGALSAGGFVLAGLMWWKGPWTMNMVPFMWYVVGLTMIAWGVVARRTRPKLIVMSPVDTPLRKAA